MSLYTSVYWTKRVAVILSLVLFICSGWRIFSFVSTRLTIPGIATVTYTPEAGFSEVEKISFTTKAPSTPNFSPTVFNLLTNTGNYDVDNGEYGIEDSVKVDYPKDSDLAPIANVFKIQQGQIGLSTTEIPYKIAENLGFTKEPLRLESAVFNWRENNKDLWINGQYLNIKYKDENLRKSTGTDLLTINTGAESLKSYFETKLTRYGILPKINSFNDYTFGFEYVRYDAELDMFVPTDSQSSGTYLKIYGVRNYENYMKLKEGSSAQAVYPNPNNLTSNNYLIIKTNSIKSTTDTEVIAEMNLYNWPVITDTQSDKFAKEVQTYRIKTPRQAYAELKNGRDYLMTAVDWDNKKPLKATDLDGIQQVNILQIKMGMYEDTANRTYIQPVYQFICKVDENGKQYFLKYIIPALTI